MTIKIFKYDVSDNRIHAPEIQIIRTDEVHDDYYNGNFVWGIVDENDKNGYDQRVVSRPTIRNLSKQFHSVDNYNISRVQLGILEKQSVEIPVTANILGVEDENGRFYLYYVDPFNREKQSINLVFYKTGQKIDESIESLEYLGWMKIYILQELAVYCFRIK